MDTIIEQLLGESANSLSQETQDAIIKSFNTAVDAKVETELDTKLQLALEADSIDKGQKTQFLVEELEAKHKAEIEAHTEACDNLVLENIKEYKAEIDSIYAEKALVLEKGFEKFKEEEVREKIDDLTNQLDAFFENHIDEILPQEVIEEMSRKDHRKGVLDQITNLVGVLELDDEVKDQVVDVQEENSQLKNRLNVMEKSIRLEEKCKGLPKDVAELVTESFSDPRKTTKDIDDNFDLLVKIFEKNKEDQVRLEKKVISKTVNDRKPRQLLSESKKEVSGTKGGNSMMSNWVNNTSAGLGSNAVTEDFWSQFDQN